jgi:hypothetical protein
MITQFLLVFSLLWLAPAAVDAVNSFTYNDDLECAYPFEQFQVQSITCAKPTYIQLGEAQGNQANKEDVCSFGDQMDLYGRVTVSQAVTREYYITLSNWYNAKHCGSYRVKVDLLETLTDNANAKTNNAAQQKYITFLAAGTYSWKARLLIPKKTFNFKNGTMPLRVLRVKADCTHSGKIHIVSRTHFSLSQRAL